MVDFAAFGEEGDDFSVTQWINSALKVSDGTQTADQNAAQLVVKLQLLADDIHESLSNLAVHTVSVVPKSIRDLDRVRKEASAMRDHITHITERLVSVEDKTQQSIRLLAELDDVKLRMETCMTQLKEAERVGQASQQLETLLASREFAQSADNLGSLNKSFKVLDGISQFQDGPQKLQEWSQQLKSAMVPAIRDSFVHRDLESAVELTRVFEQLDWADIPRREFVETRSEPISERLSALSVRTEDGSGDNSTQPDFPTQLSEFFDLVVTSLHREATWSADVFPCTTEVTRELLQRVCQQILGGYKERVGQCVSSGAERPSERLFIIVGHCLSFCASVYTLFVNIAAEASDSLSTKELQREIDQGYIAILDLLNTTLACYTDTEAGHLSTELTKSCKLVPVGVLETVRNVTNSIPTLFWLLEEALNRFIQYAVGPEVDGLIDAVTKTYEFYVSKIRSLLDNFRKVTGLGAVDNGKPFEWQHCQAALQLYQLSQTLTVRQKQFEDKARSTLHPYLSEVVSPKPLSKGATENSSEGARVRLRRLYLEARATEAKKLSLFTSGLGIQGTSVSPAWGRLFDSLEQSVQALVFDTLFIRIRRELDQIPSLESWKAGDEAARSSQGEVLPSFSLSPSSYVTVIGEHILSLPEQLEPFAQVGGDDSVVIHGPRFESDVQVASAAFSGEQAGEVVDAGDDEDDDDVGLDDDAPFASDVNGGGDGTADGGAGEDSADGQFTLQWMSALARGMASLYVDKIQSIPRLSNKGVKQLVTDIQYLLNVVSALGVSNCTQILEHVQSFLEASQTEMTENRTIYTQRLGPKLVATLLRLRGFE